MNLIIIKDDGGCRINLDADVGELGKMEQLPFPFQLMFSALVCNRRGIR